MSVNQALGFFIQRKQGSAAWASVKAAAVQSIFYCGDSVGFGQGSIQWN
jgi:hypothetical protein